jgi:hypothetical protein
MWRFSFSGAVTHQSLAKTRHVRLLLVYCSYVALVVRRRRLELSSETAQQARCALFVSARSRIAPAFPLRVTTSLPLHNCVLFAQSGILPVQASDLLSQKDDLDFQLLEMRLPPSAVFSLNLDVLALGRPTPLIGHRRARICERECDDSTNWSNVSRHGEGTASRRIRHISIRHNQELKSETVPLQLATVLVLQGLRLEAYQLIAI